MTEQEYYDLVKRNVSDWVADAELAAAKEFEADEVKAHKIEASFLEVKCTCEICKPPKVAKAMDGRVAQHVEQMWKSLSVPEAQFSKGGVIVTGAGVTLQAGEYVKELDLKQKRAHQLGLGPRLSTNKITADTIYPPNKQNKHGFADKMAASMAQYPPNRSWAGDDNYSEFIRLTNREPATNRERAVAADLQKVKDEGESYEMLDGEGTVLATRYVNTKSNRILYQAGITPNRPDGALGYDPRLW